MAHLPKVALAFEALNTRNWLVFSNPIMRNYLTTIALFVLLSSMICGCMTVQPLAQPSFEVASQDHKKVHEAIQRALVSRKWAILANNRDGFDAEYKRSVDQGARIRVSHQGGKVSITYLGSTDLQYGTDENGPFIHKRYNGWIQRLERDIQIEVGKAL